VHSGWFAACGIEHGDVTARDFIGSGAHTLR
jgi:hypothetical protein